MIDYKPLAEEIMKIVPQDWPSRADMEAKLNQIIKTSSDVVAGVREWIASLQKDAGKHTGKKTVYDNISVILDEFQAHLNIVQMPYPPEPRDGEPWPLDRDPSNEPQMAWTQRREQNLHP